MNILPKIFHVDIPTELSNAITKAKTDEEVEQIIGTEWLIHQSQRIEKVWCTCVALLYVGQTIDDIQCRERNYIIFIRLILSCLK